MQTIYLLLDLLKIYPDQSEIEYDEASDKVTLYASDIALLTSWHHKLIKGGYEPIPRKDSSSNRSYLQFKALLKGDK